MTSVFFAFTAPGASPYLPGAAFLLSAALTAVCAAILAVRGRAAAVVAP
jgi:DHA1 family tetracycline resistance protein-like MFS transporter